MTLTNESPSEMSPGPAASSLRAHGVSRSYRGVHALKDVTLEITSAHILGLIGPNGAGKSTLVNILSGFDRPDAGSIQLGDRDVTRVVGHRRSHLGIARTFQHGHLFHGLTVRENVEITAIASGRGRKQSKLDAAELLESMELTEWADREANVLPHGVERRLGVARALATSPSHVLLDEPAAGLNEGEIDAFAQTIRHVNRDRGIGVLLIDHNMPLIMGLCDRVHVLVSGTTLLEGTPKEVRSNQDLADAYLGSTAAEMS